MPKKRSNGSSTSKLSANETDTRDLVDTVDPDAGKINRPVNVRVTARQGESHEQMLRRFSFAAQEVVQKVRDLQFFEKPSKIKQRREKMRIQQVHKYGKQ